LASSPKSNAAYMAINNAQKLVRQTGDLPVPLHLRNAPNKLMKQLDYGKDYLYSHDYPGNFVTQEYMPDAIANTKLYDPGKNQREQAHRNYLKHYWKDKYNY
jgi:putative ATPase